nr:hypothetical protein [Tanacetum cinerariifolium]
MDDFTHQIIDEDQSTLQEVQTEETHAHDVHDVIESDEHDLSDASPYADSESDNECRRPTPNSRKYWILDVPVEERPTEGDFFDNFDEAYNMYLEYSQKARFSIRKSTTKRKNDKNNLDNLKACQKLDFSDKVFIHRASLSNIGPTKAHRLRVAFMGGYHKICGDVENDSEFKKLFHKLTWNVHIGLEEFEQRWHALIGMFNLSANAWLSEMFEIRDRCISGYFKDLPMCYLMKTTYRSESSNAFFWIHSHQGNILVQIMLCFEAAMEKQRYTQRVANNQRYKKKYPKVFIIALRSVLAQKTGLKLLLMNLMEALRVHVIILDVMDTFVAIYGPCIEETDQIALDIHTTIEYCVNHLRNDTEKLTEFLAKVNELKKNLDDELPPEPHKPNNEDIV